MKKVIVLVGPTGSGKTKYSIELAKAINAEIINGDSVQIYQELNVGSAKIKEEEKDGVVHHLFDRATIKQDYTVFNYQNDVRNLIEQIDIPLIVGGTGFYIKAALYNYEFNKEEKTIDYSNYTNEQLYNKLVSLDPLIEIDRNNRHRLIRALTQAKHGTLRSKKRKKDEPLYDILTIYLDIDRKKLKERLYLRLDKQLEDGFIDEVKYIRQQNVKLNMIGYRELDQYLDSIITLEEAKENIISSSMRLAKRQKTWFKNQMSAHLFDPLKENTSAEIIKLAKDFLKE